MKFIFERDTWQEIYGAIRKNKVRTIITVIGVTWGVFLFVFLLGMAKGLDNSFRSQFNDFATNTMFVWGQQTSIPNEGFKRGRRMQLTLNDVETLESQVDDIEYIAPRNVTGQWGTPPGQFVKGSKSGAFKVFGDYPTIDKVSKKKIFKGGRFINEEDIKYERKVCVIGEDIYKQFYDKDEEAIGDFVRINGIYFKVIGVYKPTQSGFEGDDSIFLPFTTFQTIFNQGENISWMVITAKPDKNIVNTEATIKTTLKRIHNVHPDDTQAFGSFNLGEEVAKINGFLAGMRLITYIVGIATLIAGVIAIGNVLLITVKERTREIGVRRALGATPAEVRGQIMLESVLLTFLAGLLGFIFGTLLLWGINTAIGNNDDVPILNPTVDFFAVTGALLSIVLLGTIIGLIPAQKAVSIKPIEALREE
ncbi:putative ABC transport system permease protein [Aquimarina sp. EL_43]|uniref:ABC transporter permease n=1 Tax=Aquimarina TaxID=290174 RepID=UPI000471874C|nr:MULTISPECIES: ABC transporter permease [Aquimarina]MBG6132947.1 putative ABC transport system permease protein [Aquimarina sp. EL_35]MBG6152258.1 putative ABC transport system permease protein [Aquimarina sp. EL_32]MBG6171096.1 putative ABC transport system permease protein [Aquimarina sp. EL_43]